MNDRNLLTPFFLDRPSPAHHRLAHRGTWVNGADPPEGSALGDRLAVIHEPLAAAVYGTVASGKRPVSIAGDCCAVIPVLAGLQRAGVSPRLLWFDAHGDFNTPSTTPSGFIGGMPLAMLVGRGDPHLLDAVGTRPLLEKDVLLCDARDLDPEEARALAGSEVRRFGTLDAIPIESLADRPLHVHLDVDFLSVEDAPAVLYPVPGGPRLTEVEGFARRLAATMRPASLSVSTWVLDRDPDRRTEAACLQALQAFLG